MGNMSGKLLAKDIFSKSTTQADFGVKAMQRVGTISQSHNNSIDNLSLM